MVRVPSFTAAVLRPVLFLCLSAAAAASAAAAPAGTVVGISGACFLESAGSGSGTRSALQLGAPVQIGDAIDVAADAKLKLRMADGSIVAVGPGTHMTVTAYAVAATGQRQNAQISMPQGLLHAIVAPMQTPAKFEVDTAVGTAAVRSTDWLIEATPDNQQVSVLRGSVVVTSAATHHSVIVPANEMTRLARGHDPLRPRVLSRNAFERMVGRTETTRRPERAVRPTPPQRRSGRAVTGKNLARRPTRPPNAASHHTPAAPRRGGTHPEPDKKR